MSSQRSVLSKLRMLVLAGGMLSALVSPVRALETEEASAYWKTPTEGLGEEINADPMALQSLFALPPDPEEGAGMPARKSSAWLGITMKDGEPVFLKGDTDFSPSLQVVNVFPDSSADRAGLLPGDIILATDEEKLSIGRENSVMLNFHRRVRDAGADKEIFLKILRDGAEMEMAVLLSAKPTTPVTLKPHPVIDRHAPKEESLLHRIFKRRNLLPDYRATLGEMRERVAQVVSTAVKGKGYNPFRLREINSVLYRPMALPLISRQLTSTLRRNVEDGQLDARGLLVSAMRMLDFEPAVPPPQPSPVDFQAWLVRLLQALADARKMRAEAIAGLTSEDIAILREGSRFLMVESLQTNDVTGEETQNRETLKRLFLNIALKVDWQRLTGASLQVMQALDVAALKSIKNPLEEAAFDRPGWGVEDDGEVTRIHTPEGLVIVGGAGDNVYSEEALVIIDLGGNDRYLDTVGGNVLPFRVVIDFSGNDLYLSQKDFAQGAGFLGGGFLIDLEGDDHYQSASFAQGAGVLGVGMLVDAEGNDVYRCHAFCQGAGFLGIGIVAELSGNDQFSAAVYAQGFGFIRGLGVLLERQGHDRFFAGGVYPDHREPEKAYLSMSQGFGYGLRPWDSLAGASGGIGILDDARGNDSYIGDYFSQGSAYWFALGILNDSEGHDQYIAARYSQGAGIHLAAGMLNDATGDDQYLARFGVSQGCGHDLAVGFLLDNGGDDRYIGGVLSQGVGNGNGLGVLNDNGGQDEYHLRNQGQGHGNPLAFRQLNSFGILFDTGGGEDRYSSGRRNNQVSLQPQWGLLADLP